MNKNITLTCLLFLVWAFAVSAQSNEERPNFVILFADDLGYSDIGCYGGEINTPNLDKLASEGIRFTHFMNCSKCAPSRAALLTGLYPIEAGCNGEPAQMINCVTIAEVLQKANYNTWMSGKWHAKELPHKRGFTRSYVSATGGSNYFEPSTNQTFIEDGRRINPVTAENKDRFYTTDIYTDKALEYLEEYKDNDQPFLLYLAYNAPHFPLQAWPEDIAKYRGKYKVGWDKIRMERYKRQLAMGIVKPEWKLSERDENVPAWENFDRKDDADLTMAVYAAMVDRLDQNIGRVLDKLDEIGAAQNTVVLFFSDNGSCAEGAMWDGIDPRTKPDTRMSQAKLGREWANAGNTPYRKFKRYMYNGGQFTPFIVRWPKGISEKGTINHKLAHLIDLAPSFYELANATYPENKKWHVEEEKRLKTEWNVIPLSGKSMVPLWKGEAAPEREYFYGHFQSARMIMQDEWKLVSGGYCGAIQHLEDDPWELYKTDDATEQVNMAAQYPALVEKMDADYRAWIDRADSLSDIRSHKYFRVRYTKEQQVAADKLAQDDHMQKLLEERKVIGLKIVDALNAEGVKLKGTLGMEKAPMSYYGLVHQGEKYRNKTDQLKVLYKKWEDNVSEAEQYCQQKGEVYKEVWRIQERIRLRIPASDLTSKEQI